MKGGREGRGPPSADLLVCFPPRAHLSLMPKPICSPARPSEPCRRHPHHLKRPIKRACSAGQASPLARPKSKHSRSEILISEPTSPKVTCAGQIKVKAHHKPDNSCKNWQSVMEEIEKLHKNKKQRKKHSWAEALGFKKEVMQFLTCLRSIKLDFRCFGSIPTSDDEENDDDDEEVEEEEEEEEDSRTVFSKWFMALKENNQNRDLTQKQSENRDDGDDDDDHHAAPIAPPPNALLLMRCRSAPAKSWLEEKQEEEEEEEEEEELEEKRRQSGKEEEKKMKKERLIMMRYNTDFSRFSTDIAKETWVVGGMNDPLSRSRSWKR